MAKTNLEYVQENLETKLDGLNEKVELSIKHLSDKIDLNNKNLMSFLEVIDGKVTKTNGRLLKAEADIQDLYKKEITHSIECPRAKEFKDGIADLSHKLDKNEEDNFIIKVISRYPKQIGFGLLVYGVLTIGAFVVGVYEFKQALSMLKIEQIK